MTTDAPLAGLRVVHLASLGPGPYIAMVLADLGASVTIVDRPALTASSPPTVDPRRRGQRSIQLDLRTDGDLEVFLALVGESDVFLEGMRPGAAERLGIGPEELCGNNERLIYARATGWGQSGPFADRSGHDINYIALSGALYAIGENGRPPQVPLNLVGDYAGGGLYLALGILAAVHERTRSGLGQVVDGAIVDGVASLTAAMWGMAAADRWSDDRGANVFDGSRPWYRTYRTSDGKYVAVGAIEDKFFNDLLAKLELDDRPWNRTLDSDVDLLTELFAERFAARTQEEWNQAFAGSDACVTPVLPLSEVAGHAHHRYRRTYVDVGGVTQPAAGPRFSRSRLPEPSRSPAPDQDRAEILAELTRSDRGEHR